MTSATTTISRRISPASTSTSAGARESLRLAAIDVGSNSIHMVVGQADADGGLTTLWRLKEPVGLGRMSFPSRRLSKVAMDSAIATLSRFKQAALQRGAEKIVTVATSAVREATNGGDLIERARRELGLFIRVVSARDEARLIYLAVRQATTLKKPHLIVDIGGGSVEFIVGDERRALLLESRKLGAARMTAKFVHTDPLSKSDREGLRRHYERELTALFKNVTGLKPIAAIGTSGTLENIAAMCGSTPSPASNGHGANLGVIERRKFDDLLKELVRSDAKDRSKMRGLDDQRRDQIVAGAMLVGEIFDRLHLKRITICPSALREGILLDYLSRHLPDLAIRREIPDPRRRSVLDLARRCDWHKTHSEQVTCICLKLFDELRSLHKLASGERELIEYAAMLHDIGWHIASKGHHKHTMYLISNGALKEFAPEEVQIIANIARYHRKSPPSRKHDAYAALSAPARRVVDVGAALLRIADGLDRSHTNVVTGLTCRIDDKSVKCVLSTRSDAELEIWAARRKMEWFEEVFDRDISFALAKK
jgi:exopolyphosphatase/guanosine-5'-triphosphate,3'-diphosphate pyrophosphatase